mgnify:CR=1 FL=1
MDVATRQSNPLFRPHTRRSYELWGRSFFCDWLFI